MSGKDPSGRVLGLRRSRFVHVLSALLCVAPIACSEVDANERDAQATSALIVGSLSPAERDAVVFLRANHADGAFDDCTGTLLSPHVVVTAKHCVTLVQPGEFVCTGAGTLVEKGLGAGSFGAKIEGARIEIHPGTAPVGAAAAHVLATFTTESGDACHDDVAALVLDTPIQQDTYPLLRAARPTLVGERVRLVGYGTVGHDTLIERREVGDVRVLDVGRDDGVPNPNATTPARSFVVGGGTACFGDSGGPALSMTTGALTGIYSRITGDCFAVESRNTFMLASSFSELLGRAFALAGEEPRLEPALDATSPDPTGAAGATANVAGASGATANAGGVSGATTNASGATANASGATANASGATANASGATANAAGAGGAAVATALAGGAASTEPLRHDGLRCSLTHGEDRENRGTAAWLLLASIVEFSRRRFGRRPSSVD